MFKSFTFSKIHQVIIIFYFKSDTDILFGCFRCYGDSYSTVSFFISNLYYENWLKPGILTLIKTD